MKAVVLTGNAELETQNLPDVPLAPGECKVRVRAAGVCSSDIARSHDKGAYFYPLVMGHELAGEIVEVTPEALAKFKVGDAVTVFPLIPCEKCSACAEREYAQCSSYDYYGSRRHGGFAETLNVKAWNLLKLPKGVSYEDASLMEPFSVVFHALKKADLLEGKNPGQVLIIGAGFLGLLAAAVLRMRRPEIELTVVDRNQFKLDLLKDPAVHSLCLKEEADWESFAKDQSGKFPVVIEAVGVPHTFRNSLRLARRAGTVVWMGNISGDLTIPKAEISSVLRKEIRILGTWNSSYHPELPNDWTDALAMIEAGFSPSRFVTKRVSLEELPLTLRDLSQHKRGAQYVPQIKVVVHP